MRRRAYRDRYNGSWLVAGREHSWGSFDSKKDAHDFIAETEEEDRKYRERMARLSEENRRKIEQG